MDLKTYFATVEPAVSLARKINVAQAFVSHWRHGLRRVPAERCPDVERATGGLVTCEELRPDLAEQWAYLRGTARRDDKQEAA